MGCGNTKTEGNCEKFHLKIYNSDQSKAKKIKKTNSLYPMNNTEEINQIANRPLKPENKIYLKMSEIAKNESTVEWKNLLLDNQTYYDLLNALEKNENLEHFLMEGIEIENSTDTFISLARSLMKQTKLKSLRLNSLSNLGNKKAKSLAKIMATCKNIELLVLNEIELDEEDAEFIGLILNELSTSLIYFEIRLVFFNSKIKEFLAGLKNNNTIQELILNKINLTEVDFGILIGAISSNFNLIRLDLSNNSIKNGTKVLKNYNLNNLKILQLNNCSIDDESFLYLMEGIQNSLTLRSIELNNNLITEYSTKTFVMFFETNRNLNNLYILNNPICKRDVMGKLNDSEFVKIIAEI